MDVFLIPVDLCTEIERMMNSFQWGASSSSRRGMNWQWWDRLCIPKNEGGMVFKKLRNVNLALLAKQAWNFIIKPDSLVTKIYKARNF